MRTLKGYVRNNYRVERSIAEGHIAGECITLFSRYLSDMETKQNRQDRNSNSSNIDHNSLSIFNCYGKPLAFLDKFEYFRNQSGSFLHSPKL